MRMIRSVAVAVMLAVVAGALAGAHAAPMTAYSKAAFVEAQNAGKPIILYVHASW